MDADSSSPRDKGGGSATGALESLPSEAVNDVNMVRSAELQSQWNALRDEMDILVAEIASAVAPTEEQLIRKDKISAHMIVIKDEMTAVLARAQEKLPPEVDGIDGNEGGEAPVCSKTGKHRIERTYDSSDSEGPPASRPPIDEQLGEFVDSVAPCSPGLRTDREATSARVRNERTVLTALGTKLRSTLLPAASNRGLSGHTGSRMMSEERENLKLEESRLERELRALRRETKLDDSGEKRVAEITVRLKEIADLSLDNPIPTSDEKGSSSPTLRNGGQSFKSMARAFAAVTPRRKPANFGFGSTAGGSDASVTEKWGKDVEKDIVSSGSGKGKEAVDEMARKKSGNMMTKRWGKFTSGLEKKLTTLSKGVNRAAGGGGGSGAGSGATSSNNSPSSVAAAATKGRTGGTDNEFTEVRDRLAQRGEKLGGLGKEAEGMREGATDMLAAARALRKKNEKKGLFS